MFLIIHEFIKYKIVHKPVEIKTTVLSCTYTNNVIYMNRKKTLGITAVRSITIIIHRKLYSE